ncbi:hypothetical protein GRZ55_02715 [Chelativorans sp. ZYF759]|uniref:hypothetical protein n=1 Tax=Chelativorans sp. ZYF759 TaxID=2692213 RepID=UPI00145DAE2F|nr:hypothetical protein [Chelativorans sp. ZYF759]NMG38151.1 hypothetical protein [Chelativorans sp. ZYF759]
MVKQVKPTEARQGRRGAPVLVILIVGLLLALVVWWGVGMYGTAIEPAAQDQVGGDPMEQSGEETPPATQPPPETAPAGPAPQ